MGFPRQEYWSGLPFPTPGDLPDPGIQPTSLASPALTGRFLPLSHLGSPNMPPGPHKLFSLDKKNIYFCIHATDVYWEPAVCISADRALNDVTKTVTSWSLDSSGETPNGGGTSVFSENTFLWWWCPFYKNWLSLLWKNNSHHQLSKYLSLAYLRMPLHTSQ